MVQKLPQKARITAEHVKGLVDLFLRKNFDEATEIPDVHMEWWNMCCDPHPFVAIAAPRNHAKSTAVTHSYTLACILLRERQFVLIVSDTETQAAYFLNDIKKELVENEDIVAAFGIKTKLIKDSETDFIVEFNDGYQVRVMAKGSEQKLRGVKWNHKRPDLIILDDLENDEIVMNKDRRLKFRQWFMAALLPMRAKKGIVRYVGTILHMDAMLERIMPKHGWKDNEHGPLWVRTSKKRGWYTAKYKAHDESFAHILWPERWPEEALRAERQRFLDDGQGDKYSQEFLNVPIDESNAEFRRTDFIPMEEADRIKKMHYYIGTDLATKGEEKTDFTVFVVGGVDQDGILNIVDVIRGRMDSVEQCDVLIGLQKRYDPHYMFFEKGALSNSILPMLVVKMIEEEEYITTQLMPRVVDKVQYAQTIKGRMRTRRVKFDINQEWFPELESECLRFPRNPYDDQVDALAILGHGIRQFIEAPTKQEQEEDAYDEARRESGLMEEGRNEITGY